MRLTLKTIEHPEYHGCKTVVLCNDDGDRLPHHQLSFSCDDATGVVTVSANFKVDGAAVAIK